MFCLHCSKEASAAILKPCEKPAVPLPLPSPPPTCSCPLAVIRYSISTSECRPAASTPWFHPDVQRAPRRIQPRTQHLPRMAQPDMAPHGPRKKISLREGSSSVGNRPGSSSYLLTTRRVAPGVARERCQVLPVRLATTPLRNCIFCVGRGRIIEHVWKSCFVHLRGETLCLVSTLWGNESLCCGVCRTDGGVHYSCRLSLGDHRSLVRRASWGGPGCRCSEYHALCDSEPHPPRLSRILEQL